MHQVVTNSTVDGILAALFAAMIIVVILDASRIWLRVIASRQPLSTTETPFVESQLFAPAGLFPTSDERAALAGATAGDGGAVRTDRFTRESETTGPRGGP